MPTATLLDLIGLHGLEVIIGQAVSGLRRGAGVAKLAGLLLGPVSLAEVLHLENLGRKLLLRHLVDRVLRVLVLDLTDDLIVVGRWLHALPCLLRGGVRSGASQGSFRISLSVLQLRFLHQGPRLTLLDRLDVAGNLGLDALVHFARAGPRSLIDSSLILYSVEGVLDDVFVIVSGSSRLGACQVLCDFLRC